MENPRPAKVAVVNEVRERLSSSGGAILTEYRGLNVSDLATLRRSLREAGGQYKIYKNTLVRFAVSELGLEQLDEMLLGPTAIAFVDGDAAPVDSPPAAEPDAEAEAVSIPDHPGVSPAPDETENPPDFEGESPPSDVELPESPAPDETARPPEAEMTEPPEAEMSQPPSDSEDQ